MNKICILVLSIVFLNSCQTTTGRHEVDISKYMQINDDTKTSENYKETEGFEHTENLEKISESTIIQKGNCEDYSSNVCIIDL